jgi:hypothetical protein
LLGGDNNPTISTVVTTTPSNNKNSVWGDFQLMPGLFNEIYFLLLTTNPESRLVIISQTMDKLTLLTAEKRLNPSVIITSNAPKPIAPFISPCRIESDCPDSDSNVRIARKESKKASMKKINISAKED